MDTIPDREADNPHKQIINLDIIARDFIRCIRRIPADSFLSTIDGWEWSPRDITAHLIAWNRYTITGCEQMRRRETPFYFIDPGEDFSKINAAAVQKYTSRDKQELIAELEASLQELVQFLLSASADWQTDYGALWRGETVTIRNTIDGLIEDYISHRQQIEEWLKNTTSAPAEDPLVHIATAPNEPIASMWAEFLENEGIQTIFKNGDIGAMIDAPSMTCNYEIYVSASRAEEAKKILAPFL